MLLPELIEHICRIKASIVAQLPWNDLQCLGIRIDEQLRLASNCAGVIPQEPTARQKLTSDSAFGMRRVPGPCTSTVLLMEAFHIDVYKEQTSC